MKDELNEISNNRQKEIEECTTGSRQEATYNYYSHEDRLRDYTPYGWTGKDDLRRGNER